MTLSDIVSALTALPASTLSAIGISGPSHATAVAAKALLKQAQANPQNLSVIQAQLAVLPNLEPATLAYIDSLPGLVGNTIAYDQAITAAIVSLGV